MKTFSFIPLTFLVASTIQAATIAPKITAINVTPKSAPAGTIFKFTADLNSSLPAGSKVKITFGKGFTEMAGMNQSYQLSRTIFTTGKQNYKVAIINAKNLMEGVAKSGSYTVTHATLINHAPTLTLISTDKSAIINTQYTVTLSAKDVDANLNSITMNWGDSTAPETLTATDGKNLVFSHTFTTTGEFALSAFATDKSLPALNSNKVSKTITVNAPPAITPPVATPSASHYTKIANDGSVLPDNANMGLESKDWACTRDNKTGLVWELKFWNNLTLHDANNTYTWFEPDASKNNGVAGVQNGGSCNGSACDTNAFKNAVNAKGLCGANDWRIPTGDELISLIYCADGNYSPPFSKTKLEDDRSIKICAGATTQPTIDLTYFPNTMGWWNWTSTPAPDSDFNNANLILNFYDSYYSFYAVAAAKDQKNTVRLVRNVQPTNNIVPPLTIPVVPPTLVTPIIPPTLVPPPIVIQPPVVNTATSIAGNWKIHINENDGNSTGCGDGVQSFDFVAIVGVNGNAVTVALPNGETLKGTLSDDSMLFQSTTFEDGMTTNSSGTLTFQNGKITGISNYLVSSSDGKCPGTDVVSGFKL